MFHILREVGYLEEGEKKKRKKSKHIRPIYLGSRVCLFSKGMHLSFTSITSWVSLSLSLVRLWSWATSSIPLLLQTLNPLSKNKISYTFMDLSFIQGWKIILNHMSGVWPTGCEHFLWKFGHALCLSTLRSVGLMWLLFLIGHLYMSGVWQGLLLRIDAN